ncbi:class I SAM-dependent methyltransferase [archaeon]|nr:class I SAM-dependent methyltransferase [archaeon]
MEKEEWNKVSRSYYEDILSPLKNSKKNPLFSDLKNLKSKRKNIIDLGCGLGELEPLISKYFKHVVALDISPEMINKAKLKNKNLSNINFYVNDISDLKRFHSKFDIALSINSHISPDLKKLDKIFKETYNILKKKGVFIAIFPAMEVYLYQAMLLAQKKSRKEVARFINDKEHDFLLGIIDFEKVKQKCYYQFEISYRLKKAGFKNIKISKVLYSWNEFEEAGQLKFLKEDLPWDWYVICEKNYII